MDHTALWLAEERTKELRRQAESARRGRATRRDGVRARLLRQLRSDR